MGAKAPFIRFINTLIREELSMGSLSESGISLPLPADALMVTSPRAKFGYGFYIVGNCLKDSSTGFRMVGGRLYWTS